MDIDKIRELIDKDNIIFLSYGGYISQSLITSMTEGLEKEAEESGVRMGIASDIFTVFIELSQNVMNYSKTKEEDCTKSKSEGLIVISKDGNKDYFLDSQNIISLADKCIFHFILPPVSLPAFHFFESQTSI